MRFRKCVLLCLFISLCVSLTHGTVAPEVSPTTSPGDAGASSTPTPEAGTPTTHVSGSTGVTEAATEVTEVATASTEVSTVPTLPTVEVPQGCLCDLTPGFCDIGCCCDNVDCGVTNLSTVFTGCPQKAVPGICLEKWLMFRANVDSALVTETDSLFCVRSEEKAPTSVQSSPPFPSLGASYHFAPPGSTSSSHGRPFYRVDDVIQTYFSNSSVLGLLRQPSPGFAAAFCTNRNPAKFLRSSSMSCTRMLSSQSCTMDPTLNARSYHSDISLIKIPVIEMSEVSDLLVPVNPLSDWPAPVLINNSCVNVVRKVEFIVGYSGRGEITNVSVNVVLADVDPSQMLLQTHSVYFQLTTPSPTPGEQTPTEGLRVGSPLIGRFIGNITTLTVLQASPGGVCSSDPGRRAPVLFTYNTFTGCTFSSPSTDCLELRSQIYGVLQGLATPEAVAMNSGDSVKWTRVITEECPFSPEEKCDAGCLLPNSLSIQVLWARQGQLHLPQNFILGAKYIFKCRKFKCPLSSPLLLTTEVTFADTTLYPPRPRVSPQPSWKFPFGFFTRGSAELDGHMVTAGGETKRVTRSLMLLTLTLLKGLEFFNR